MHALGAIITKLTEDVRKIIRYDGIGRVTYNKPEFLCFFCF